MLAGHAVETAAERGWSALENGELLAAAEGAGFEVLLTADKNLRYQQNLTARRIAILELPTNRLRLVQNCLPAVETALAQIHAGDYVQIS